MLTLIVLVIAVIIASELVALFTPLVVFGVTELVQRGLPLINGWVVVTLIVPALSAIITWLTDLVVDPGLGFWAQFGFGLLAVFINELYKQLSEALK